SPIQSITAWPCFRNSAGDISAAGPACVADDSVVGGGWVGFIVTNIKFLLFVERRQRPLVYLRECRTIQSSSFTDILTIAPRSMRGSASSSSAATMSG